MTMHVPSRFEVLPFGSRLPPTGRATAFLLTDNWDDLFQFSTQYRLYIFDEEGSRHELGYVKIGQFGMSQRRPELPSAFENLDERFFSLGQDESYYLGINELGASIRDRVLAALRDVAADLQLFDQALKEEVTRVSLLRDVRETTVRGQFHRLAHGGARLSKYTFTYQIPSSSNEASTIGLEFKVRPVSNPPSNIHVLIGRNGVGKTHLLNDMTNALVKERAWSDPIGSFVSGQTNSPSELFSGLVSVTFSAFDPFRPLREQRDKTKGIEYSYVGLKRVNSKSGAPKTLDMLAEEFAESLGVCVRGPKGERWRRVVRILESDPMFHDIDVSTMADLVSDGESRAEVVSLFKGLSSGHKIVLLTLTRLVETVEERTLVLLDEPEAHLHPPLLSAFVRALSDLLTDRNGVAILATHSPVVLQEVPRTCTWILRRSGQEVRADRPELETFGENVGILTREVFGLEVTQSGFHRLLSEAVQHETDFDSAIDRFDDQLGMEARAIIRGLIATRDADAGSED